MVLSPLLLRCYAQSGGQKKNPSKGLTLHLCQTKWSGNFNGCPLMYPVFLSGALISAWTKKQHGSSFLSTPPPLSWFLYLHWCKFKLFVTHSPKIKSPEYILFNFRLITRAVIMAIMALNANWLQLGALAHAMVKKSRPFFILESVCKEHWQKNWGNLICAPFCSPNRNSCYLCHNVFKTGYS